MECAPIRSQAWLDAHEHELAGLPVESAVTLVEGAGLTARVVPYASAWLTQEQRRDRITLWLTAAGELGAVDAG